MALNLLRALGPQSRLFNFSLDQVSRQLSRFENLDFQSQNLLFANFAELGTLTAAAAGDWVWPLSLPSELFPIVLHKTNTITYTCGYHRGVADAKAEYAFLFSSDCWKLREIMRSEPLDLLRTDPLQVRRQIGHSGWSLSPNPAGEERLRDVAVLLWHIKAELIFDPQVPEFALNESVRSVCEALGLPTSHR